MVTGDDNKAILTGKNAALLLHAVALVAGGNRQIFTGVQRGAVNRIRTSTTRRYTVGYIRDQRKFGPSPAITLKGHWMAALGFEAGQKIEVITESGQLIIRLAGE